MENDGFTLGTNAPYGNDGMHSDGVKKFVQSEASDTQDDTGRAARQTWSLGRGITEEDLKAMNTPLKRPGST